MNVFDMIKAIIFDSDGTMFSAKGLCESTLIETCQKFDVDFDKDKYEKLRGSSRSDRIKKMFPKNYKKMWPFWDDLYKRKYYSKTTSYPEVITELKRLYKKNYKLFIFSTKNPELIKQSLKKYKIEDLFLEIIGENFKPKKPNKKGIVYLSKKYDFKLNETFLVGDTKVDQESAKNAKIPFVLVEYKKEKTKNLTYTYKIKSFKELKKIIKKIENKDI